jgi:hypothetical protein
MKIAHWTNDSLVAWCPLEQMSAVGILRSPAVSVPAGSMRVRPIDAADPLLDECLRVQRVLVNHYLIPADSDVANRGSFYAHNRRIGSRQLNTTVSKREVSDCTQFT